MNFHFTTLEILKKVCFVCEKFMSGNNATNVAEIA